MRSLRPDKLARIFRREFVTTITRPGFVISTVALPLLPLFLILLTTIMDPERILAGERRAIVAVVDESGELNLGALGLLDREPERSDAYIAYDSRREAISALLVGEVTGVVIVPEEVLGDGVVETFRLREGLAGGFVRPYGGRLIPVLRACLLNERLPAVVFERTVDGFNSEETVLDADGEVVPEEAIAEDVRRFLVPVVAAVFLAVAIFAGAGYLLLGLSDEKENRVMELLLACLSPEELLAGKLLGIGAAGLLQFSLWVLVVAVPAVTLLPGLGISLEQLWWATGFFLAGYMFFGAVMLGIGAIADTSRHAQQISGVFTMIAMLPFMVNFLILQDPSGLLARVLTFIPLTAPMTVMLRMSIEPPAFSELFIALLVLFFSGFVALLASSRLFRATGLLYGKRPTPAEVWRWLVRAN